MFRLVFLTLCVLTAADLLMDDSGKAKVVAQDEELTPATKPPAVPRRRRVIVPADTPEVAGQPNTFRNIDNAGVKKMLEVMDDTEGASYYSECMAAMWPLLDELGKIAAKEGGPVIKEINAADLEPATFLRDYVMKSRPVVIKNGLAKWPAFKEGKNLWTDEYLKEQSGTRTVTVELADRVTNVFNFYQLGKAVLREKDMTIAEYLAVYAEANRTENYYIAQQNLLQFAELVKDVRRPAFSSLLTVTEVLWWVGAGGQITPTHYDDAENILAVLEGTKEFTVWDPTMSRFLYPIERGTDSAIGSAVNVTHPDYAAHPLYAVAEAAKMRIVANAGDMIYLPAFWWHRVRSFGRNVAVNFWFQGHSLLAEMAFAYLSEAAKAKARGEGIRPINAADDDDDDDESETEETEASEDATRQEL